MLLGVGHVLARRVLVILGLVVGYSMQGMLAVHSAYAEPSWRTPQTLPLLRYFE